MIMIVHRNQRAMCRSSTYVTHVIVISIRRGYTQWRYTGVSGSWRIWWIQKVDMADMTAVPTRQLMGLCICFSFTRGGRVVQRLVVQQRLTQDCLFLSGWTGSPELFQGDTRWWVRMPPPLFFYLDSFFFSCLWYSFRLFASSSPISHIRESGHVHSIDTGLFRRR
jgi:hypothetical protein